jgi:hypothetical protein
MTSPGAAGPLSPGFAAPGEVVRRTGVIGPAPGGYVRRRPDSYFFFAVFLTERLRAAAVLRRAGFLPRFAVDLRREDFAFTAILGLLD